MPDDSWTKERMNFLHKFMDITSKKFNMDYKQANCVYSTILKYNYDLFNSMVDDPRSNFIQTLFSVCGVSPGPKPGPQPGPKPGPQPSPQPGPSDDTCKDCTPHQTCDLSNKCVCNKWWSGDNCDNLSGLSIGLITGGSVLLLLIIVILIRRFR